jgi:gliding motility-associated-like protein
MDNYNGCTSTSTISLSDRTQLPVLSSPLSAATLDCGAGSALLLSEVTGPSGGLMYFYFDYPPNAAFSPSSAININGGEFALSGTPSPSVLVSSVGQYQYLVTNTLTGCAATGTFNVLKGGLEADFAASPPSGYAPLSVIFTPTNYSGLGAINNIWNFGNGTSLTSTNSALAGSLYNSAGTYTVMLISQKGDCMDTTYKVIKVDLPSRLEVPNVFTPNGDGSNDVFFLKAANMGEIHAIIFDRWGSRVYEATSSTGNISWDGKNLQGKDCAAGVYFYVITANGNDDKHYEQKGNVSIYR